jgi:DNA polymerase-3 subunit gamma/tau
MNHVPLAARYRPQTFAELVGQETACSALSRAAAEDKAAPAYLFSGTRGVGKTTLARVFAKALNCEKAPTAEPCNVCGQCRKITQGIHVDVLEIDGASNRGIEDARRLREHIGYAPLEARRKVFIIDEAHMLTRESFNALLKTLEEPPPGVTFILATTEAHKFPVTIVSRCQHFIFQRLPEARIEAHLVSILEREQASYEPAAVRLLARRAAGSARDAISLMGQVLALGGATLSEQNTRQVLGLAGQELFGALLDAAVAGDCAAVSALVRVLLDQGVDIGFFLRELGMLWRNLFLLSQAGADVLPALELPAEEGRELLARAKSFSLAHIHAAWQMTLDAQRRVILSLEPASALELLLLNIALLPRLVPVEQTPLPQGAGPSSPVPPDGASQTLRHPGGVQATAAPPPPAPAHDAEPAPAVHVSAKTPATPCEEAPLPAKEMPDATPDVMPDMDAASSPRPTRKTRERSQPEPRPSTADFSSHPLLQALKEQFGAQLIACTPLDASPTKPTLKENTA